uniref:Transient receptor potential cation channel, subfamily C, member 4 associated protein a n=1 Tax=Sparus aurata TaxID=8175 RepID=A0A671W566_SPAAU
MATLLGCESPCTGGKRRNCNSNIVTKFTSSKITGRGFSRGTQLPGGLLQERDKRAKWHGIPTLLQKLYESSHPNSDLSHAHSFLKVLSSQLSMEAMSFVTEDRKTAQESTFPNTHTFDLFGGVDLLVEILMRPTLTMQKKKPKMNDDLVKDCLSVLYNCCICTEEVTKSLAGRDDFVLFLFTLMTNKKTFLQTATLIEDILGVKKEMIQLEGIPNLSGLVQSFDQQQLANFCRILSVTISEPDVGNDDKHTLLAKNAQQKRNASPSRAEVNQVTLLNIPGFIERLCKLATRKVSEATGANFLQELEDWYTWLDNALVLDALMQMATEEAEQSSTESSDESSLATSPLRHRLPQSMKIVHEIMYKLCILLLHRCTRFRYELFNPTIFLLLQSFSDHHENKYLLLNSQELNELSAISMKANIPEVEALVNTDRSLVCDGKKGLLTRILTVMKREPPDSSFSLSSPFFKRISQYVSLVLGATSYADQMFLLKRGLLEHILFCIIDSGCTSRDVLQSYFDLLGELMKFNIDAFKRFNKYVNTPEKFQTFLTQINSSLVDSNMLVRCIVLSLDRFESQTEDVKVVEVLSECCLLSYMARVENRLSFLFRLINIINVIVIYKDSTCLENSSCIPFSYWKETVSVLLGPDRTSPCAIASYIDEPFMDLDRDLLED